MVGKGVGLWLNGTGEVSYLSKQTWSSLAGKGHSPVIEPKSLKKEREGRS